ncbi:MAG: hypothetical protein GX254_05910 [Clostridiales bacterium]|mgnify:CR=1 FL=1|jgi:serine protease inhibitor|nr:hypothetical protein [Clostridiales bacterium]
MLVLPLMFTGCEIIAGIKARSVSGSVDMTGDSLKGITSFAVALFQNSFYSMISPLSVLCALAVTANGAQGETLAQMEDTINLSMPELNTYMGAFRKGLP